MGERKQAEYLRGLFRNIPCIKQKMKHGNYTIMSL